MRRAPARHICTGSVERFSAVELTAGLAACLRGNASQSSVNRADETCVHKSPFNVKDKPQYV